MRCAWRQESAACGDGIWIVGVEKARISVLAPPGVPIFRREGRNSQPSFSPCGWRWAIWLRHEAAHWPVIDRDTPDSVLEVDTPEVLRLVNDDLHEFVWTNLRSQLEIARGFSRHEPGMVLSEDMARAGAITVAWLTDELIRGFPDRAHLLRAPPRTAPIEVDVPDDASELVDSRPDGGLAALRCDAPLKDLVLHWLSWRLPGRRSGRWVAQRREGGVKVQDEGSTGIEGGARAPTDLSAYGWGRETGANASELGVGEVLS